MNRWTVRLAWMLPMASVLTSMAVHHLRGAAIAPIVFISQADMPGPESILFTFGLTLSGLWQAWTVWAMTTDEPNPWSPERCVGLLASLSVVIMANRSMYTHLNAHILAAMGIFVLGWAWLGLVQRRSRRLEASNGVPQRQAALWCIGIGFIFQTLGVVVALEVDPSVALPTANVGHPWWAMAALGEYLLVGGLWWGIATIAWDPELMDGPGPDANKA
ncbi:MAG: hypothetical protein L7U48_00570 [Candidatus Poseidoniaceae archaeon]|nr:hypothetical protein [Candidatus Poseidoniaceae archaeon]